MTRLIAIFLVIAAVAIVGLSSADIQCTQAKVGLTYKADSPLYYYTCVNPTTEMMLTCLSGSGYINNGTLTGCVPWQLWSCTSKEAPPTCSAASVGYLFPTVNPQNYYLCTGAGTYTLQSCPTGTAYNPEVSTKDVSVGCISWTTWWVACPY